jgi:hypothetical protein
MNGVSLLPVVIVFFLVLLVGALVVWRSRG